jgi:hypothetical protein
MGAALILPVVVLVMLAVVWVAFGARKTRQQAKLDDTLPVDPYARRREEVAQLQQEHAEADPALTEHPARRP